MRRKLLNWSHLLKKPLMENVLSFSRNLSNKYVKRLTDTAAKAGLDVLETASKQLVHIAAEAKKEFI